MIVYDRRPSWLQLLFRVRATATERIWRRVMVMTLVAVIVASVEYFHDVEPVPLILAPFTIVGLALGIFLGFRNNTAYDRFWEGRKLWGRLVNTSRSLTRQILTLVGPLPHGAPNHDEAALAALREDLVHRVIAYVHAFRLHLRNDEDLSDVEAILGPDEVAALRPESNRPIAILQGLGNRFRQAWDDDLVHAMHLPVLERSLETLTDIQGGCERIKSTPIPFSYTVLMHRTVAVYCLCLPFALVPSIEFITPVVVALVTYTFFGLDAIGDEIENPFDGTDNDLPLHQLSRMIDINLRERLGEENLPEPLKPVDHVLL